MRRTALVAALALAACSKPPPEPADNSATIREAEVTPTPSATAAAQAQAAKPAAAAPAPASEAAPAPRPSPGEPAVPEPGAPRPTTSLPEGPFTPDSAQGAADVVQTFAAYAEQGRLGQAFARWERGSASERETRRRLARYAQVRINVGGPGAIEGAAGSRYVSVPVRFSGALKTGGRGADDGVATLRRVGEIDGATAEQKRWHITGIDWRAQPRR